VIVWAKLRRERETHGLKWMNEGNGSVNNKKGRKNYRRLNNELEKSHRQSQAGIPREQM
jgi:hypothetical protein